MARNLSDKEITAFRRDGVVHVTNAIEEQWMQKVDAVIEQQLEQPSKWGNDGNPGQAKDRMFTDRYLWKSNQHIKDFVMQAGCGRLAGQAMGSNSTRFYFDHLLVKEPETSAPTPWHQDVPYWPFNGQQICSVWVALSDATIAGSAMEFVRGSHLDNKYYMPELFAAREDHPSSWQLEGEGERVPDIEADRDQYDIIGWDVKRGDAVIFSAWILHGAPGNSSLTSRRSAISTRWLGDDSVWYPHTGADPTVTDDDVSIAAGEYPADDDNFPHVWSKE